MKNTVLIFLTLFLFGQAQSQIIESSTDQIDFGVVLYENPQVLSIELTNLDEEEVSIEEFVFFDIYESSPFQVVNPPLTIPGSGSATLDIEFDPVHNINHNTELVIKTSGNRGSLSIDLRGTGEYPGDYYDLTQNEMDSDLKEAFSELLSEFLAGFLPPCAGLFNNRSPRRARQTEVAPARGRRDNGANPCLN